MMAPHEHNLNWETVVVWAGRANVQTNIRTRANARAAFAKHEANEAATKGTALRTKKKAAP